MKKLLAILLCIAVVFSFAACGGSNEEPADDQQGGEAHVDVGGEHQDEGEQGAGEQRQQIDKEVLHCSRQRADTLVDSSL